MDERKYNRKDPWDDAVYGTGNTQPPKSHGGIIALLLIIVIFLSGIVSALGLLNIQMFNELNQLTEESEAIPMSFSDTDDALNPSISPDPTETVPEAISNESVSLKLNKSPESMENIPQEGGMSWQDIYAKNIGSVVSITTTDQNSSSTGTGVILSASGYIVTNCHVVDNADEITVLLTDDRTFSARLIGSDAISDLAVLHIDATELIPAEFGDSNSLRVGDAVAAIGDPLGIELRGTMTDGIVSAINRNVNMSGRNLTVIQTNAALNSGNSGGPLVNCFGQVIGINTMKISTFVDDAGVEGLGFAIPSTTVKEIVDQLISQGYVSGRPTLGLEGDSVSRFDQYYYRIPAGLYITAVDYNSDAFTQGIEPGDILLSINGTQITNQDSLNTLIYTLNVGDSVEAIVYRNGNQYRLTLTLTEAHK